MKKYITKKNSIWVLIFLFGLILGYLFSPVNNGGHTHSKDEANIEKTVKKDVWTCSMHPQIRMDVPGNCPICGMELILAETESSNANEEHVSMSERAMRLAHVQTVFVEKKLPKKTSRLNGMVDVDERKVFTQTSHISGRIEKLFITYTGEKVKKGQLLASIYSPELIQAQKELLESYKYKEEQKSLFEAAKQKLRNWKLRENQINSIIQSGKVLENFPIFSDIDGIVTKKYINTGDHVKEGSQLFTISDFSNLWVLFDVYEDDLPWISKGDEVSYEIDALPGETFHATIQFIDPFLDPKTRIAKARASLKNSSEQIKPGLFVIGHVTSTLKNKEDMIQVPKTSVLWTGTHSYVYVKSFSEDNKSYFVRREVKLGPLMNDTFIILDGLEEEEEIVRNGVFQIDAASQLAGKTSMMND